MCCSNIFPVCYTPFSLCSRLSELLILTKSNLPVSPFMYCVLIFLSHHQTSTLETVLNRIKFLNSSKQFVQLQECKRLHTWCVRSNGSQFNEKLKFSSFPERICNLVGSSHGYVWWTCKKCVTWGRARARSRKARTACAAKGGSHHSGISQMHEEQFYWGCIWETPKTPNSVETGRDYFRPRGLLQLR